MVINDRENVRMERESVVRACVLVVLLGVLTTLFVLGGTGWPASSEGDIGPDAEELASEYEEHVGESIETSGTVIDAGEGLVEIEDSTDGYLVDGEVTTVVIALEGEPEDLAALEDGDVVTFYGEVGEDRTILVEPHRLATREPWETQYMDAV